MQKNNSYLAQTSISLTIADLRHQYNAEKNCMHGEINYSLLYSPLYPYCNIFSEKIKKKRKKELTEEGRCGNIINALEKRRKKSGSGAS